MAPDAGYASAFEIAVPGGRAALDWARAVFDGAPAPLRVLLWLGWRFGLGLRLESWRCPAAVLGWPVGTPRPDAVVLAAGSPILHAWQVVQVDGAVLRWSTLVRRENRLGRAIWALTAVLHHRLLPALLRRAVRRAEPRRSGPR